MGYGINGKCWTVLPAVQVRTDKADALVTDVTGVTLAPRLSRVSRVSRPCPSISLPRLGECPLDMSTGFGLGILASQFPVRFHHGEQGAGFIRAADDSRPMHVA